MKFYNREKELENLKEIETSSKLSSKMTVIVGRRRIGKTKLIQEAYKEKIYLFVSKKNEALLCEEFISIIQNTLNVKVFGQITKFKELFEYLMNLATTKAFTLVIDEFQEFLQINDSIYSDMQNIWDNYKDNSQVNLIFEWLYLFAYEENI